MSEPARESTNDNLAGRHPSSAELYGRVGIALLALPAIERSGVQGHRDLPKLGDAYIDVLAQLSKDSRISELQSTPTAANAFRSTTFAGMGATKSSLDAEPAAPHQHVHVATFREPITFTVHTPKRLQAPEGAEDTVPADEYWVAWNGVILVVAWRSNGPVPFGSAGGIIVFDVLAEALKASGYKLRVQPCDPNCGYPFAHQDLKIEPSEGGGTVKLEEIDRWTTRVTTSPTTDTLVLVAKLAKVFADQGEVFAKLRSSGRVVRQAERAARRDLGDLLRLQYERTAIAAMSPWKSVSTRWKKRTIGRDTVRIIAGLWLRLATLDQNRRSWDEYRYRYEHGAPDNSVHLLFRSEYPDEVNGVETLQIDNLQNALTQMSARADSRSLAWATAGGALAGAVLGAGLGAALGAFFGAITGQG